MNDDASVTIKTLEKENGFEMAHFSKEKRKKIKFVIIKF